MAEGREAPKPTIRLSQAELQKARAVIEAANQQPTPAELQRRLDQNLRDVNKPASQPIRLSEEDLARAKKRLEKKELTPAQLDRQARVNQEDVIQENAKALGISYEEARDRFERGE